MRGIRRIQLREQQASSRDGALQLVMRSGVDDIEAGAKHRDRAAVDIQRPAVRAGIDAACKSAHHRRTGKREDATELSRHPFGIRRCATGANHGHAPTVEERKIAIGKQHSWRTGCVEKALRISEIALPERLTGARRHERVRAPASSSPARGATRRA